MPPAPLRERSRPTILVMVSTWVLCGIYRKEWPWHALHLKFVPIPTIHCDHVLVSINWSLHILLDPYRDRYVRRIQTCMIWDFNVGSIIKMKCFICNSITVC